MILILCQILAVVDVFDTFLAISFMIFSYMGRNNGRFTCSMRKIKQEWRSTWFSTSNSLCQPSLIYPEFVEQMKFCCCVTLCFQTTITTGFIYCVSIRPSNSASLLTCFCSDDLQPQSAIYIRPKCASIFSCEIGLLYSWCLQRLT